jgi:urocanate hydratase
MDLVPTMSKYLFIKDTNFKKAIKELFRIGFVNIFKLRGAIKKIKDLKQSESYYHDLGIHIDNKSLDGVLDNFMKMNCFSKACVGCTFCETIANRHVRISGDPEQHARDISSLNAILDGMVSGSYF